jgi:hypothetical protein
VVAVAVGGKNDGGENATAIEEAIARGFFRVVQIAKRAERVCAGVQQEREKAAEAEKKNDAEAAIGAGGVARGSSDGRMN